MICLTASDLQRFIDNDLSTSEEAAVTAHIESCSRCQRVLDELTALDRIVDRAVDRGDSSVAETDADDSKVSDLSVPRENSAETSTHKLSDTQLARLRSMLTPDAARNAPEVPSPTSTTWPSIPGYEILAEIGRGGMGTVYRARDLRLERVVAIKCLRNADLSNPEALVRFHAETQTIAKLEHPNIVRLLEVGTHREQPYCVLEFVDGGSLAAQMSGKPWHPRDAATLVATVARAMEYSHCRGIIHRDLKPGNILLPARTERRRDFDDVKIADFGLAKSINADLKMSETGMVAGTPSYMAPEQVRSVSRLVGPTTDVHALGAILYELLTGQMAFAGTTRLEVMNRIVDHVPVLPSCVSQNVPKDLEYICLQCLAKEPSKRYQTAQALADDLHRFLAGDAVMARQMGIVERVWAWTRRRPAIAGLLAAVMLALLLGTSVSSYFALLSTRRANHAIEAQLQAAESRRREMTLRKEYQNRLVAMHIGRGVRLQQLGEYPAALPWLVQAFRLEQDDPSRERMHRLRLSDALKASPQLFRYWTKEGFAYHTTFNVTNEYVLSSGRHAGGKFRTGGGLAVWRVEDQRPVLAFESASLEKVLHAAFSPTNARLATIDTDGRLAMWDLNSQSRLWDAESNGIYAHHIVFNRNGSRLACFGYEGKFEMWDAESGDLKFGLDDLANGTNCRSCCFSPDGQSVAIMGFFGRVFLIDAETGDSKGPPLHHDERGALRVEFSPDGSLLATATTDSGQVKIWDVETGRLVLTNIKHRGTITHIAFSQDGQKLITSSADKAGRVWEVRTGHPITPRLEHRQPVTSIDIDRGGKTVVTGSTDHRVQRWNVETGEPVGPPMWHSAGVLSVEFDRSGERILTGCADGSVRIWVNPEGKNPDCRLELDDSPTHVHFHPSANRSVVQYGQQITRIWDLGARNATSPLVEHDGTISMVDVDRAGKYMAVATDNGVAVRFTAAPQQPALTVTASDFANNPFDTEEAWTQFYCDLSDHNDQIAIGVAHRASRANSSHGQSHVGVWDLVSGRRICTSADVANPLRSINFSPVGEMVALVVGRYARADSTLVMLDAQTLEPLGQPMPTSGDSGPIVFSSNGRFVSVSSTIDLHIHSRCAIHTWLCDAPEFQQLNTIEVPGAVRVLNYNADSDRLLVAFANRIRIFDPTTGKPLCADMKHPGTVFAAMFSGDGQIVLSADQSQTAHAWDAMTGESVVLPLSHASSVNHITMLPDNATVATASADGLLRFWKLVTETRTLSELEDLASLLSGHRIMAHDTLQPLDADELQAIWKQRKTSGPR